MLVGIDQRSSRVPGIEGGRGLHRVDVLRRLARWVEERCAHDRHHPVGGRERGARARVRGVADRDDVIALAHLVLRAEREVLQR